MSSAGPSQEGIARLFRRRRGALSRLPRSLRFTRDGWWFCAVALGIGFAAMNTGNNLLYLLLGMLLSLIIASGVLSEMSLRGVTAKRMPPVRLYAGSPFLMGISLNNSKRRLPSFSIEVEDFCEGRILDKKCYFLKLPAGRTQQTSYRHGLSRRGRYAFTGFRISTKFPFALFRKSRYVDHYCEVLVYPEILPLSQLPTSLRAAAGELSQGKRGRRGRFHGLREYRAGDDRRDIHWRSTARRGRLIVREYEEEAVRQITLFVDNALTPEECKDEKAVRQLERVISWAASLSVYYLERGYGLRLLARGPGARVPLSIGSHQSANFLGMLSLLPTVSPDVPFASGEGSYNPRLHAEPVLIVRPGQKDSAALLPGAQILEAL